MDFVVETYNQVFTALLQNWVRLAERVANVMKGYPTLSLTHGRKVLEIRPGIAWDKGQAVNFLLESLGMANPNDVLPVYIGDDRTDEDAFKVISISFCTTSCQICAP
jgi:trehalose 6-phosphate phosphatase